MSFLISGLQARVKNSAAYADELGLMMIANGEELPYLLTANGEKLAAGLTAVAAAPVITDAGSGTLTASLYAVYAVVSVSENTFPLVAAKLYSNPSPLSATYQIPAGSTHKNSVTFNGVNDPIVTHIYVFRTAYVSTALLAETAAAAGLLYFVGKIANANTSLVFEDNLLLNIGNDQISYINFSVPQFRFVVWDGSYFWGFGNHPFTAQATWDTDGIITLQNPSVDKFYGGRDDQFLTFDGIITGGIDGRGTFLFKQLTASTGQAILSDGTDATLPTVSSGNIVVIGESASLYRSGYRNPWQWGYLQNIAGEYIPTQWYLKVAGSLGTAIAIVPDQQLLKLDMEFPALCVTFSLQASNTEDFSQTKRQVSRLHSVTSHFSQFVAISKGRQVLWGMDFKTLSIVECDGYTQVPISGPISILLRKLTKNRSLHMLSHGLYDTTTEINAIWLSTNAVDEEGAEMLFDLCVYQHAPTGFWGIIQDYGILCSAPIEDPESSKRNVLVGTENGFVGKAFDDTSYGNWLPSDSIFNGFIQTATANSITRAEGQDDFNPTDGGLIGNFCMVLNSDGLQSQIRKITGVTSDTLFFDEPFTNIPATTDPGLVDGQWKFFIGLIELRVLKYMDDGTPSIDKVPRELWATLSEAEEPRVEYYPEHAEEPNASVELKQDNETDAWQNKLNFPSRKGKSYGLAVVERSYNPTKFFNFTVK